MLTVAVFSYNRGAHLENCVASVLRNMPWATVQVYDDASDDPETCEILKNLDVAVLCRSPSDKAKHGGLYQNMQQSLLHCETPYLLFLQEDMQIVRSVTAADFSGVARIFTTDPKRGFVCPVFMKSIRIRRHMRLQVINEHLRCYMAAADMTPKQVKEKIAYYDVCIADVARLRSHNWQFQDSEHKNVVQARTLFSDMPMLGDPFAFYCPEVPIYRNRTQSFAARIAANLTTPGVKSFLDMTSADVTAFKNRSLEKWPVAEHYLTPSDPLVRKPFAYKDVKARWWLSLLHKLEEIVGRKS